MAGGVKYQPQGVFSDVADRQSLQDQINELRVAMGLGLHVDGATKNLVFDGLGGDVLINGGASIKVSDGGTVQVQDAAGDRAVTLGLLDDASYGLSVTDPISGATMPLSQLAFGAAGDADAGAVAAGAKGAWTADGLSVDVSCSGGRLVVLAGATLTMGAPTGVNTASAYYSFDVAGPTPAGPATARAVFSQFGQFTLQSSVQTILTGLSPGVYTISGRVMRTTNGADAPPSVSASARSLVILPF